MNTKAQMYEVKSALPGQCYACGAYVEDCDCMETRAWHYANALLEIVGQPWRFVRHQPDHDGNVEPDYFGCPGCGASVRWESRHHGIGCAWLIAARSTGIA